MKSDVQKLAGLTRKLNVEVPPEVVSSALGKMYKDVQRVAKFKGFRPGKAPIDMVKSEYRSKVESDVATRIIEEHYGKALTEHSLQPVNMPEIEFDGLKEGESLKFSATFEVRPDIELKKYTGLELEREILEIGPKQVDEIIENIRKNRGVLQPLAEQRPVAQGDTAIIDFKGLVDGAELPGGSGQEHPLEIGTNQFIPGFEEGVIGMSPDETKVLKLKFPDEYHSKDIAGKEVEFTVVLKEIKHKILPALDDEFAKTLGNNQSLETLRAEVEKDLTAREEKRVKDDLKNNLLHALVEANRFDVPKSMIAEQKKAIVEDVHQRMEQQGMSHDQFDEYKEKWDQDFEKSAEFVIRSSMLINAIAKKENLFSSDEDYEKKLSDYAKESGIEVEKIRAFYSKQENRSRMSFQMTEEKVVNFLLEKATMKDIRK